MEEENKNDDKSFRAGLYVICAISIISIGGVLWLYLYNFSADFGDQDIFAKFGDFFGGLLNPILSFLTIVLLILSIRVQLNELKLTREEMTLTRKELEQSADAMTSSASHQEQLLTLQRQTELRREVEDDLRYHYSRLDELFSRNVFTLPISPKTEKYSLTSIFTFMDMTPLRGLFTYENPEAITQNSLRKKIREDKLIENEREVINDVRYEIECIVNTSSELLRLLKNPVVRQSRHDRTHLMIYRQHRWEIISDDEYNKYESDLTNAMSPLGDLVEHE